MKLQLWLGLVLQLGGLASLITELFATQPPGKWHGWLVVWFLVSIALLGGGAILAGDVRWQQRYQRRGR